jgi:hypothetical protein
MRIDSSVRLPSTLTSDAVVSISVNIPSLIFPQIGNLYSLGKVRNIGTEIDLLTPFAQIAILGS